MFTSPRTRATTASPTDTSAGRHRSIIQRISWKCTTPMKGSPSIKEAPGGATTRSETISAAHTENTWTGARNILKDRPPPSAPTYWPASPGFSPVRIIPRQPTNVPWASCSFQRATAKKGLMRHATGPSMRRPFHTTGSKTSSKTISTGPHPKKTKQNNPISPNTKTSGGHPITEKYNNYEQKPDRRKTQKDEPWRHGGTPRPERKGQQVQ